MTNLALTKQHILDRAQSGDRLGVLLARFEPRETAVRLVGELMAEGRLTLTTPREGN